MGIRHIVFDTINKGDNACGIVPFAVFAPDLKLFIYLSEKLFQKLLEKVKTTLFLFPLARRTLWKKVNLRDFLIVCP